MRLISLAFLLAALVLAVAAQNPRRARPPAPSPSQAEDQKAIADLQRRDIDANIALDTDKILILRTEDVVYLVPGRPPLVGQDAVRKYLEELRQQLANWDMLGYEEQWQEVQVSGDFATQWGTISIRARKEGEQRESSAVRNVMQILKRQPDGDWKIARAIWNIQSPQPAEKPPAPTVKPPAAAPEKPPAAAPEKPPAAAPPQNHRKISD